MTTWRLFIAAEAPAPVQQTLGQMQGRFKQTTAPGSIRWVSPEASHLTLKFLGDVDHSLNDAIQAALAACASGHPRLELAIRGTGCFPDGRRPRVLWAGIEGDVVGLKRLQADVEHALTGLGFAPDDRPYAPHLTIGRVNGSLPPRELQDLIATLEKADRQPSTGWPVEAITLFRSELRPGGSRYTALSHHPLGKQDQSELRR